jgi:hypothetical protein
MFDLPSRVDIVMKEDGNVVKKEDGGKMVATK